MSLDNDAVRSTWTAWLRIAAIIAAVVALVNLAAVAVVAVAPGRCVSCHQSSAETLELSTAHAAVACLDCHGGVNAPDAVDFAGRQVYGMYLRLPGTDRPRTAVSDASCVACHDVSGAPSDQGAIRMNHATCSVGRSCTDCHSRTAHGDSVKWSRDYDMFDCVSCHMAQAKSVECDLCHTERSREQRVRTGSFALTHAENWRKTHGMGDSLICAACHTAAKCVGCHGAGVPHTAAFATTHGKSAVQKGAQCTSCHNRRFCDDCHGLEMPHPPGFVPGHSSLVKSKGRTNCDNCHVASDCTTCHVKHIHPGNAKQGGGG